MLRKMNDSMPKLESVELAACPEKLGHASSSTAASGRLELKKGIFKLEWV